MSIADDAAHRLRTALDEWRRLNRRVGLAEELFSVLPGVLSNQPPHERALRLRAIDAAIATLSAAEDQRRLFRDQTGVPPPAQARRRWHAEMLDHLHRPPGTDRIPARPPDGDIPPGASVRVQLRIDHAAPQEIAALRQLLRSLPPAAATVEILSPEGVPGATA